MHRTRLRDSEGRPNCQAMKAGGSLRGVGKDESLRHRKKIVVPRNLLNNEEQMEKLQA